MERTILLTCTEPTIVKQKILLYSKVQSHSIISDLTVIEVRDWNIRLNVRNEIECKE